MIEVNNISFKYAGGKNLVFDDFSLELKQDTIYGLLGKNGTTIVRRHSCVRPAGDWQRS